MDFWFVFVFFVFLFFVAFVNLPWQMAALCNRQPSCCERLSIYATAETTSTSFY